MSIPLVAHIIFRLDVGGLENGLINLVNRSRPDRFRHVIISLTDATEFARRIERPDVDVHSLQKHAGRDLGAYRRLYRLLRALRPDIVHTRNIGTMDCQLVAWLAGVSHRVHGEHGWDVHDPDGTRSKYRLIRYALSPFIDRFVAVSSDLAQWLATRIGIPRAKIAHICNGVDTDRYHPEARSDLDRIVLGTVSRLSEIKDPLNTITAFLNLAKRPSTRAHDLRLVVVGDGPLMGEVKCLLNRKADGAEICLTGKQANVDWWLRQFDVFLLGSLREGISNTVLEAMASGLPVVATRTGGTPELVVDGETGLLVDPGDSDAMADAMARYVTDPGMRDRHGLAARRRAEERFSLDLMVDAYEKLYLSLLSERH